MNAAISFKSHCIFFGKRGYTLKRKSNEGIYPDHIHTTINRLQH